VVLKFAYFYKLLKIVRYFGAMIALLVAFFSRDC